MSKGKAQYIIIVEQSIMMQQCERIHQNQLVKMKMHHYLLDGAGRSYNVSITAEKVRMNNILAQQ